MPPSKVPRTSLEPVEARSGQMDTANLYYPKGKSNDDTPPVPDVLKWTSSKVSSNSTRGRRASQISSPSGVVLDAISSKLISTPEDKQQSESNNQSRSYRRSSRSKRSTSNARRPSRRQPTAAPSSVTSQSSITSPVQVDQTPILNMLAEISSATKVQSVWRGYRAKRQYNKHLMKKDYQRHVQMKRQLKRSQEAELALLESQIAEEMKSAEHDLQQLQQAMDEDTEIRLKMMKAEAEDKMESDQSLIPVPAEQELLNMGEIDRLDDETKKLQKETEDLAMKVQQLTEGNEKLEYASKNVSEMFQQLNDFAKKKIEEKQELVAVEKALGEEGMAKADRECTQGSQSCIQEMRIVDVYRRCMYEHLKVMQAECSVDMVTKAVFLIKDCEERIESKNDATATSSAMSE